MSELECPVHKIANQICGGPHRWVETDLGNELLKPGEEPKGTPVSEMTPQDQAEHEEAKKEAGL